MVDICYLLSALSKYFLQISGLYCVPLVICKNCIDMTRLVWLISLQIPVSLEWRSWYSKLHLVHQRCACMPVFLKNFLDLLKENFAWQTDIYTHTFCANLVKIESSNGIDKSLNDFLIFFDGDY